tara:strand:+ start:530 stop:1786 length:1257 start_codon:yes stop_codon:yes gene_type:complete
MDTKENMYNLLFYVNNPYYKDVLENVYKYNSDNIKDFFYLEDMKSRNYRYGSSITVYNGKILVPGIFESEFQYDNNRILVKHEIIYDKDKKFDKLLVTRDGATTQFILTKLTLSCVDKQLLIDFVDESKKIALERRKINKNKEKDIVRVYYYNDYWYLFSKTPKRSIDTLYLKKDELNDLVNSIAEFFSEDERSEYLSFGIPYKKVYFLYGVPGSGKTSSINAIASHFDCDIHTIPLSTDMDDSKLVEAFSSISGEDSDRQNRKIILIEDIDCIFEDRKTGDGVKNGVTLQGLLNCMDGFTCIEGGLIFITANKPESLDNAMIRSCRVDYKLELGYADKYQTKCMFDRFLPKQSDNFEKFYNSISHLKYTTAMLQELLFFNRKSENILEHTDDFKKIVEKNDNKKIVEDGDNTTKMFM